MKIALLMLLLVATASPVLAAPHRANPEPSTITCETVRAYVSQVGLATATAIARANGMTAVQERKARQCLATRD
jgi:sulfur transfer protein SufE